MSTDFGKKLRSAREVADLSLHDAATVAGLNRRQLEQAEAGKRDLRFTQVADLAVIYGVTLDWLSGRVDSPWKVWEPEQT